MIEYLDWAKGQLKSNHNPSVYDWSNMNLLEMSNRALAICEVAKSSMNEKNVEYAFYCLEKMAQAMKDRYPQRRKRRW